MGNTLPGDQSQEKGHYDPETDRTYTGLNDVLETNKNARRHLHEFVDCSATDCKKIEKDIFKSVSQQLTKDNTNAAPQKKTMPGVATQAIFGAIETRIAAGDKVVVRGEKEPLQLEEATAMKDLASSDQCVIC